MSVTFDFRAMANGPLRWDYGTTEGGTENVGSRSVLGHQNATYRWESPVTESETLGPNDTAIDGVRGQYSLLVYKGGSIGVPGPNNVDIWVNGNLYLNKYIVSSYRDESVWVRNYKMQWTPQYPSEDRIDAITHDGIVTISAESGMQYRNLNASNFNNLLTTAAGSSVGAIIYGSNGSNYLRMSNYGETIFGGDAGDFIDGRGGDDIIEGGGGRDRLYGGSGNDTLSGGLENDTLDGGTGADHMDGGFGDDIYYVDNVNDKIFNLIGAGGKKTVYASTDWTMNQEANGSVQILRAHAGTTGLKLVGDQSVDQTIIGGAGNDTLVGGTGADRLQGGVGADILESRGGNDRLDGEGGADRLVGGTGSDTYIVDNAGDRVIESASGGRDAVATAVNYTLTAGQEIEELRVLLSFGDGAIDLTGNSLAQTLIGNNGANVLNGAWGNDVLTGKGGADTFVFANALGSTNVDRITDFAVEDSIRLSKSIFTALAPGQLAAGTFKNLDTGSGDASDRIMYKQSTGELFYDADGWGGKAMVKFAVLDNKAALTAADFYVV